MAIKLDDLLEQSIQALVDASKSPNGFVGLPSGLKDLDRALCGFDNSDLIIVGGRPAMGKTAFMVTVALNMAKSNIPVLYYSLEMNSDQLVRRIISNVTGIDGYKISAGTLFEHDWDVIQKATESLGHYPLYINDTNNWTIEDFCDQVRKDVEATQAKVIFVDYLQLFSSREKLQNRYEEIALCTRELKKLAGTLKLPIIVSSQLNRNPEYRTSAFSRDKFPEMYDLRDSGTICDDANVVLLIHRPEYYLKSNEDSEGRDIRGLTQIIIAKNHTGRIGTIDLKFNPTICKFVDWDAENNYAAPPSADYESFDANDLWVEQSLF